MIADWIKEWAIVISGCATFLLAVAAFWAIWQNHRFKKEDKELNIKSKVLNDINDWIKEAYQVVVFSGSSNNRDRMIMRQKMTNIVRDCYPMSRISPIIGKEFEEKVNVVVECILKIFEHTKVKGVLSTENKEHRRLVKDSAQAILTLMELIAKAKADLFISESERNRAE